MVLFSVFKAIVTKYNSYNVEIFENTIASYFIYIKRANFRCNIFLNSVYNDGYKCRVLFARWTTTDPFDFFKRMENDFNVEKVTEWILGKEMPSTPIIVMVAQYD
ncbi:hypothetical protein F4703DRAFT_1790142 [Phycomyces blakesleeanus]